MKKTMKMRKSRSHKNKRKSQKGGVFGVFGVYDFVPKEDITRFQKILDQRPYLVRDQLQQSWEKNKNDPTKRKEVLDRWDPPRDLTPKKIIYDYAKEMVKNKEIIERLYNTAINLLNSPEYTFSDKESLKIELESAKQKSTPDAVNSIIIEIKNKLSKSKKIKQEDELATEEISKRANQDLRMIPRLDPESYPDRRSSLGPERIKQEDELATEEISKRANQDFRMMSRLDPKSYPVRRSSVGPERTQGGSRKRKQTKRSKKLRYKSRRLRK